MNGNIYLIGGGEVKNGDTEHIDADIMSPAPKGPTFVFIDFASKDNTQYADIVTFVYG